MEDLPKEEIKTKYNKKEKNKKKILNDDDKLKKINEVIPSKKDEIKKWFYQMYLSFYFKNLKVVNEFNYIA